MMHLIEYYIEAKSWNASTQQYESPLKATEAIRPDAEVNSTNSDYTTSDYNRGCEEQYYISAYAKTNEMCIRDSYKTFDSARHYHSGFVSIGSLDLDTALEVAKILQMSNPQFYFVNCLLYTS